MKMIAKYMITPAIMDIRTLIIPIGCIKYTAIPIMRDAMTIFESSFMLNGNLMVFLLAIAVTANANM